MEAAVCSCTGESQMAMQCVDSIERAESLLRPRFGRPEAYSHAVDYLRGLIADVERKNGWQLAEQAGYAHPRGMQRVLARYQWDAGAVRDDVRRWVIAELGDPTGVLVVDETSFPKQGTHSVGVARQYCGTLGKIANCQVGVFLGYAGPKGHAGLDRALFVPEEWTRDRTRCEEAGMPQHLEHRTKPQLAVEMLGRALDAGVPAAWVVADEVYGSDGKLRQAMEERDQAYVLTVRTNQMTTTWPPYGVPGQVRVMELAQAVPAEGWQRLSCGEGVQGPRLYDWASIPVRPALREGWMHAVLLRRHPVRTDEIAYYLVYAPAGTPLTEVVRVAGLRWTIEDMFKLAKGQVGLDQYEVRSWCGWYRHITLALLAFAALTIGVQKGGPSRVPSTSRSRSQKSADFSSDSSGQRPIHPYRFWSGLAGGGAISASPKNVIGGVA